MTTQQHSPIGATGGKEAVQSRKIQGGQTWSSKKMKVFSKKKSLEE